MDTEAVPALTIVNLSGLFMTYVIAATVAFIILIIEIVISRLYNRERVNVLPMVSI